MWTLPSFRTQLIKSGGCGPNVTLLPAFPYGSPCSILLPWYPGFVSSLDELEKNPTYPYMVTCFSVPQWQQVCQRVLWSISGFSGLHPLESLYVANLVPKMVVPGNETFKSEGLREMSCCGGAGLHKRISGAGVLKDPSRHC